MTDWTPKPGERVTVRGGDEEWRVDEAGPYLASLVTTGSPLRIRVPLSWLTPVTPPLPPEPQEPGTVVWDADGVAWARMGERARPWRGSRHGRWGDMTDLTWDDLVREFGPLATTQPGTLPLSALGDERAEGLAEVYIAANVAAVGSGVDPASVGIRAVLAALRESAEEQR